MSQILEQNVRFSKSILWQHHSNYYDQSGIGAWKLDDVPYYITSNVFIANSYAQIVLRFIQDCLRNNSINPELPIYVFTLGAGSGKFDYLFLQKIIPLLQHFHLDHLKFCHVMTDFTSSNLEHWEQHPALQKFFESGTLDVAILDATKNQDITLKRHQVTLGANACANPIIAIGNYFFDSLPADVMQVEDGQLQEGLVTLQQPESDNSNAQPKNSSEQIQIDFSFNEMNLPYYDDDNINKVLAYYKSNLPQSTFLVHTDGINAINNLKRISDGNLLIITSDKGYTTLNSLRNLGKPHFAFHSNAAFSTMVNFDFLGRYIANLGGDALLAAGHEGLKTSLLLLGQKFANLPETVEANDQFSYHLASAEFLEIKNIIIKDLSALSLSNILSLMKFSYWDADIFFSIYPQLAKLIDKASFEYLAAWHEGLKAIINNYYFVKNHKRILFALGHIYYLLNDVDQAIDLYQQSLSHFGEEYPVIFNLGICYYYKRDLNLALQYFQQALTLEPDNSEAKKWAAETEESLKNKT